MHLLQGRLSYKRSIKVFHRMKFADYKPNLSEWYPIPSVRKQAFADTFYKGGEDVYRKASNELRKSVDLFFYEY